MDGQSKLGFVDLRALYEHRKLHRKWIFIEDVLDTLKLKHTDLQRQRVSALLGLLGWEHIPLRSSTEPLETGGPRDPESGRGAPQDPKSLWVRTHSLLEIEAEFKTEEGKQRLTNPLYQLIGEYVGHASQSEVKTETPVSFQTYAHGRRAVKFLEKMKRPVWAAEVCKELHIVVSGGAWQRLRAYLVESGFMICVGAHVDAQYAHPSYTFDLRAPSEVTLYEGDSRDLYQVIEEWIQGYNQVHLSDVRALVGDTVTDATLKAVLKQIGWRARRSKAQGYGWWVSSEHPLFVSRIPEVRKQEDHPPEVAEAPSPDRSKPPKIKSSRSKPLDADLSQAKQVILAVLNDAQTTTATAKQIRVQVPYGMKLIRNLLHEMATDDVVGVMTLGSENEYFSK